MEQLQQRLTALQQEATAKQAAVELELQAKKMDRQVQLQVSRSIVGALLFRVWSLLPVPCS